MRFPMDFGGVLSCVSARLFRSLFNNTHDVYAPFEFYLYFLLCSWLDPFVLCWLA
jgi:hypothetical protein